LISIKSATKEMKIDKVDEGIFTRVYFGHCLDCLFCDDLCCSYGCQVDGVEKDRILTYTGQLQARLAVPASQWFEEQTARDADFPSGDFVRTKIYRNKCVFWDHGARGCSLHKFASERGLDQHLLKPMVCSLFPVSWAGGCLFVSQFLDELPCKDQGVSVFEAQKDDLRFYFGAEFVSELERMALQITPAKIAP